jgi:hypothetical protein
VNTTVSARSRLLAILGVLILAVAAAGLLMVRRLQARASASNHQPITVPKPHPRHGLPAATRATPHSATKAALTPPKRSGAAPATAAPQQAPNGLPPAVERELSANHVVVVSLYDPNAKIDGTALREAQAGAALSGAAFVPIDVTTSAIDGLNKRFGVLQDPAVLVLRPPGDLIVRIDGFADRDTVAQAAANAR